MINMSHPDFQRDSLPEHTHDGTLSLPHSALSIPHSLFATSLPLPTRDVGDSLPTSWCFG